MTEEKRKKHNAYYREYYRKNKKKQKAYAKQYREENPDKVAEWNQMSRVRRGLSPEPRVPMTEEEKRVKDRESGNKYYEENTEACKKRYRDRYAKDAEFRAKRKKYEKDWREKRKKAKTKQK